MWNFTRETCCTFLEVGSTKACAVQTASTPSTSPCPRRSTRIGSSPGRPPCMMCAVHHDAGLRLMLCSCARSDLFEDMVPTLMHKVTAALPSMRASLPRSARSCLGVTRSDMETPDRQRAFAAAFQHVTNILESTAFDEALHAAADQMARGFVHGRLPPFLNDAEKASLSNCAAVAETKLCLPNIRVQLLRPELVRVTEEGKHCCVYAMRGHVADIARTPLSHVVTQFPGILP